MKQILMLSVVAFLAAGQGANPAEVQLQAAIKAEVVDGNLKVAIDRYKQIIATYGEERAVVAKALVRMGQCYEKLGEANAREAQKAYEQVVREFGDQAEMAAEARTRLAALKAAPREASALPALRLEFRLTGAQAGTSAAISPDGRLLAYVDWDTGDLAVRDLRSGESRMVTHKGGNWETDDFAYMPRWSPDGRRIAYYWYRDDGYLNELRVTDLSGKNVRVLYSSPYAERRGLNPVGWFPDGRALLATSLREGRATEIVRVSLDDGAISPVRKPGSSWSRRVRLSSDGKYIAFDEPTDPGSPNMDVFVMPSSGGPAVPVVTGPYDDRLLDWTPDGRRVLMASNRSGTYDAWLTEVDEGHAVGSPQLLRKELGMVTPIGFTPDGAYFFAPDLAVRDVVLVDWDPQLHKGASAPTLATEHFSGATRLPAWSYDGRKLAYLVDRGRDRQAENQVRVRDIETGTERTLAHVSGSVYGLSWSPDGASVAWTVKKTPQSPWICQVAEVDSGKILREITNPRRGEAILRFLWGPGAGVAYYAAIAAERVSLVRRDLRTGDETTLYTHAAGVPMDIAVSPDGRHLAVGVARRIMLIAATGGEARQLARLEPPGMLCDDTLAWSPDGRHVYFGRGLEGAIRLYRMAVTGGAPEDLNLEIGDELRFRPDGRRLAFTRSNREERAEIWVMENFLPRREVAR